MSAHVPKHRSLDLGGSFLEAANAPPLDFAPTADRSAIHGAIVPAQVRAGDPIAARVRGCGPGDREEAAQVWRISPLGVELVRPAGLAHARVGSFVDVTLRLGSDVAEFHGLCISSSWEEHGRTLVGVRFADASEPRGDRSRRRDGVRWRCDADYLPTGIAKNALRFGDYVHFRVSEISRAGMRLLTSLRNKFLVPGVSIESTCTFPTLGEIPLELRVVYADVVKQGEKELLSVGVTWSSSADRSAEVIGQYLLQFGPGATPEQLRSDGFRVRSTSRAFDFGWVQDEEDYRAVLALRRLAYVHAKKISGDVKDVDMGDDYDARSRIIVARHRGRIVGTVRVTFPRNETDRLKHEDFVALPASLPPRTSIVEVSKACTHPDFRGSDLFYSLVMHASLVAMQAGRRYILMSCTDSLLPLYLKIGVKRLGAEYVHPTMRLRHHVVMSDVVAIAAGQHMNPIAWNLAFGPEVWAFATRCGIFPPSAWRSMRVRAMRLFKPLAFLVARQMRRARERDATR